MLKESAKKKKTTQKTIANIILNGEMLEVFWFGNKTKAHVSLFLFRIVLEVLANAVRQDKRKNVLERKKLSGHYYLPAGFYVRKIQKD